jgi:hypothetical protein
MTEFGFKIVGKDGKVVEDVTFNDFDAVADYMLEAADKWYAGLQDPGDIMTLERKEDGEVIYSDTSSFGGEDAGLFNNGSEINGDTEYSGEFFESSGLPRITNGEDS